MSDVSAALAFLLVASLGGMFWYGFGPRIRRMLRPRPAVPDTSLDFIAKRIELYARIGKDLPRMRREITESKHPIDVLFPSWNETVDFGQRDALIGDEGIRKAMEAFSTAVNKRNRRRKRLLELGWDFQITPADQDQEFRELTDACIDAYERIRKLSNSKPQLVLQASEPIMQVKPQTRAWLDSLSVEHSNLES
ncbi:MAG: hypothetical protein WB643_11355 [Candidatus Bathyarchaeia archaeon]